MRNSKSPENVRGFVIAAVLVFVLSLCALMLLNWIENPFGAFQVPIKPHINDRQSVAFYTADRDQQMRWLVHASRLATSRTLVLGTSQLLYGMDTCAYPDMQRLTLYALQMHEVAQLLALDGPTLRAPLTLLIQDTLGERYSQVTRTPEDDKTPKWKDLLDSQATQVSLLNLGASLSADRPSCAAIPFNLPGRIDLSPEHTRAVMQEQSKHLADPTGLNEVLAAMMPICHRLHPRVVIFTLPIYFNAEAAPGLHQFFEQNALSSRRAIEMFNQQTDECSVTFIDLATSYTEKHPEGVSQQDWFDQIHFKPSVGNQLLETITSHQ